MEKLFRWMLLLALCALATGCASVAGGNVQKMYVQAESPQGAALTEVDCVLSNDKGTWKMKAPGDTAIVRSHRPMEVKCDKAQQPQGVVSVESGTRAAMFGNILVGGVIGAVVDHSSGAAYEYPEQVKVVMGRMVSMNFPKPQAASSTDPSRPRPVTAATPQQLAEPPGSGFAKLDDVNAVPHLGPRGRQMYADWIQRPPPKAFAVAANGNFYPSYGLSSSDATLPTDPVERALEGCRRQSPAPCKLYAVNNTVVWQREAPAVTAAAAAAPAAVATPVAAPVLQPVVQPVVLQAPGAAPQPAFLATGFARVDDIDAVPLINDVARRWYAQWLRQPTPRAFAISGEGHWAAEWGLQPADPAQAKDPNERALQVCQLRSKGVPCRLYAVNGAVVWNKEQAAR